MGVCSEFIFFYTFTGKLMQNQSEIICMCNLSFQSFYMSMKKIEHSWKSCTNRYKQNMSDTFNVNNVPIIWYVIQLLLFNSCFSDYVIRQQLCGNNNSVIFKKITAPRCQSSLVLSTRNNVWKWRQNPFRE